MKKTILLLSAIILLFAGCKKFDDIEASKLEIKTENIEGGWDYIKISGEYSYPVELESLTLLLSEKEDMSEAKSYNCVLEGKIFSVEATDLNDGISYYYCYEYDNGYTKERIEVKTVLVVPQINSHAYVDLGLPSGLKWATCNVGATSPEDYGDYFAWGETSTKSTYTSDNSLTYGLSISQLESQGYIDGSGNFTSSHDAATANWGGSWRMPTKDEIQELVNNCTWTWTTQNGVKGCKVTGPNGNCIFLPAAGYRYGSSLNYAGDTGYYWSSTPYDGNDYGSACSLLFHDGRELVYWGYNRGYGFTVRPITE